MLPLDSDVISRSVGRSSMLIEWSVIATIDQVVNVYIFFGGKGKRMCSRAGLPQESTSQCCCLIILVIKQL